MSVAAAVAPLVGFEGLHRHWDSTGATWVVQILPGEYYVSRSPEEVIATVLGSCVSTCIRDARAGIGGMNHFMLPEDPGSDSEGEAMRYGCFAIERLINDLLKHGAARERLEVKVFGGGQMFTASTDIGRSNVAFVRSYMADEGIPITVEDVGGRQARRLRYHPLSGKARVKHLPATDTSRVDSREQDFRAKLRQQHVVGTVELF